jgi:protein-S-isoprenylcysteine O-methyltransferase Ste14
MTRTVEGWLRWRVPAVYLVALISLGLASPTPSTILAGALITATGLLIRGVAAGYLHKGQELAHTGPYARTRHPLYLGSALLWSGFAVATRSWVVGAMFALYFLAFYPATMKYEEAQLRAKYGETFNDYARRVSLFRPRFHVEHAAADSDFSFAQYVHNREYQAAIVSVLFFGVLFALAVWKT